MTAPTSTARPARMRDRSHLDPLIQALAERRVDLGITQAQLAALRGRDPNPDHTGRLELGVNSPTLVTLREWADVLGCDIVLAPRGKGGRRDMR